LLHGERIERRRAYWTIKAIHSAVSAQLGLEWYHAIEDNPEDAEAKYALDMARAPVDMPQNFSRGNYTGSP
jgi:hypothetical protein